MGENEIGYSGRTSEAEEQVHRGIQGAEAGQVLSRRAKDFHVSLQSR